MRLAECLRNEREVRLSDAAEQGDEADEAWSTSEPRSLSPVFGGRSGQRGGPMASLSRKRTTVLIACGAIVAGVAWLIIFPSSWRVRDKSGRVLCVARSGWTYSQVWQACGEPLGGGWQPKVGGRAPSWKEIRLCSAPCEVHGQNLLLFDCDNQLYGVQRVDGDWRCDVEYRSTGWKPEWGPGTQAARQ